MKNNISLKKATLINGGSKLFSLVIQIVINAILSRLLPPEEFGVVAIITVFINFFNILSDLGLGSGIIQNKKLKQEDYQNIFSFTIYLGIILGIIFIILSYPISFIYKNDIYISMGIMLFFSIFFNTINMVPNALLLKNKKFSLIGIRSVISTLVCGVITIILAYSGLGCYSLILNTILTSFVIFLWNYFSYRIKFSLKFDFSSINKIKNFSLFQFAFSFVNYFSRNLDNLIIGAFISATALAYYDKAYRLMLYPITMLNTIFTPVLHPFFSEYQDKKDYVYDNYLKIVKKLAIIGAIASAFCYFNASEIITIVFGDSWIESITSFRILSLSIFFQLICTTTGSIYQSLSDTKSLFKVGLINTLVTTTLLLLSMIWKNINIVSIVITISYHLHFIISFYVLIKKVFKKKFVYFLNELKVDYFILIVLLLSSYLFNFTISNIYLSFILKSIYLVIIYIILLFITKEYKNLLDLLQFKRRKK